MKNICAGLAQLKGYYVPSLYEVSYKADGTIRAVTSRDGAPAIVHKRVIKDIDRVFFPDNFVVPFLETVHDRAVIELFRGCIRGCRFCQAGFIYRPFREKDYKTLNQNGYDLCASTGYDEIRCLLCPPALLPSGEPSGGNVVLDGTG